MIKFFTNSKDNSCTKVKLTNSNIDIIKNDSKTDIIINPCILNEKQTIIYALELIRTLLLLRIKDISNPKKIIFNKISISLNRLSNKLKVE